MTKIQKQAMFDTFKLVLAAAGTGGAIALIMEYATIEHLVIAATLVTLVGCLKMVYNIRVDQLTRQEKLREITR